MIATLPPPVASPERLLTIADLEAMPDQLPSGPARYELVDGTLVIMAPASGFHAGNQSIIQGEIYAQGQRQNHGRVFGEYGLIVRRNPDTVYVPDVSFFCSASMPIKYASNGYVESIPDLVVEVQSPSNSKAAIAAKTDDYIAAGVKVVWNVNPVRKCVAETRGDQKRVFNADDTLTAEDIIPGFNLLVSKLFE